MMKSISVIIISALFLISCNNQKIDLSLKLKAGETYTQKLKVESNIDQDIEGKPLNMQMGTESTLSYAVKGLNNNNYDIEVSYVNLNISMLMPKGRLVFRSKNPIEGDTFSMILSEMCNKPFKLILSKEGKVIEVSKVDQLFESVFEHFDHLPESQILQIKQRMLKAFGAEAFKSNLELITTIYPEQSVGNGDSWALNIDLHSDMQLSVISNYTLVNKDEDDFFLEGQSKIETKDKNAIVLEDGMPLKYDIKGTMNSELTLDRSTSWVKEAQIKQSLKGHALVVKNPRMPNGMTIPMTIETKYSIAD